MGAFRRSDVNVVFNLYDDSRLEIGPGVGTLTVNWLRGWFADNSRMRFQLGPPGIIGSEVNDLFQGDSNNQLSAFVDVVEIEALPGFGPGEYTLMEQLGSNMVYIPEDAPLEISKDFNYSYTIENPGNPDSSFGTTTVLIVTANPETYTEWMEARFFEEDAAPAPEDDSSGDGKSNALSYFLGLDPQERVSGETVSFQEVEYLTPETENGVEASDPTPHAVVHFRKNHHLDDEALDWVLQSSETLEEGSWTSHDEVELTWVGLTDDGEATVWEASIPLTSPDKAFFRIAVEMP